MRNVHGCCGRDGVGIRRYLRFFAVALGVYAVMGTLQTAVCIAGPRRTERFHAGWRFASGEQGESVTQADFDDSGWQAVRVPHDWAISGPFDPQENGYAGKLPWRGVAWYRKTFQLDEADRGRRVYFDFDGVMAFPKVFVNGQQIGRAHV